MKERVDEGGEGTKGLRERLRGKVWDEDCLDLIPS